jgi:hypothetical protein
MLPKIKVTINRIVKLVKRDDCTGLCRDCGHEQAGVEPDVRGYECGNCGLREVYGAEELLCMIA